MKKLMSLLLVALMLLSFAACSGGGGNSNEEPHEPTVSDFYDNANECGKQIKITADAIKSDWDIEFANWRKEIASTEFESVKKKHSKEIEEIDKQIEEIKELYNNVKGEPAYDELMETIMKRIDEFYDKAFNCKDDNTMMYNMGYSSADAFLSVALGDLSSKLLIDSADSNK